MMTNYLINEWIKWNQLAIDSFKDVASTNVKLLDIMLTSWVNPSVFAEVTKEYISISKELGQVYTNNVNELLRVQLKHLNLDATSEASKSLMDIYVDSITNLGKQQIELMHISIDTTTDHLKELKGAKKLGDVVNVQVSLFTELQQNVKTSTIGTMGVLNSINEALEGWTYKSLDAIADSDSYESSF